MKNMFNIIFFTQRFVPSPNRLMASPNLIFGSPPRTECSAWWINMDTVVKIIVIAIVVIGIICGIWFEYRPDDKSDKKG